MDNNTEKFEKWYDNKYEQSRHWAILTEVVE
jgi:hypothetical protein